MFGLSATQSLLREARWLSADRAGAVARVLLLVWVLLLAALPWLLPQMQVARDFAAFWTSARLAWHGHPAAAYGPAEPAALAALLGPDRYPVFFYPPTALLLWLPFAALPFRVAAAAWVAASTGLYLAAVGRVLRRPAVVATLAYPALLLCGLYGQNGLFSAALFGGAVASIERRPLLGGALLGCLAYKPQLAVLVPLALAAGGRWRALAGAAGAAGGLMAVSLAAFGLPAWAAFVGALPQAGAWNASGTVGFARFTSLYAAVRLLGGGGGLAWAMQGAGAVTAILALAVVARRRPGAAAETALLVVAALACVPFPGDYDLTILAVPGAWLVAQARGAWLPYERAALGLLYVAPFAIVMAGLHGVPLGPAALALLAALLLRRIARMPARA